MINSVYKEPYIQTYTIIGSYSIKKKDINDYKKLLIRLEEEGLTKGDALMIAYNEVLKPSWD